MLLYASVRWEVYLSNVHVGKVGKEVVADKKAHQHPVINDSLEVIAKW